MSGRYGRHGQNGQHGVIDHGHRPWLWLGPNSRILANAESVKHHSPGQAHVSTTNVSAALGNGASRNRLIPPPEDPAGLQGHSVTT